MKQQRLLDLSATKMGCGFLSVLNSNLPLNHNLPKQLLLCHQFFILGIIKEYSFDSFVEFEMVASLWSLFLSCYLGPIKAK